MRGVRMVMGIGASIAATTFAMPRAAAEPRAHVMQDDVALEYIRRPGAASCPNAAQLRERTSDTFDFDDPFVPPGAPATYRIRMEIRFNGRLFRANIDVLDSSGTVVASTMEQHRNCDALVWVLSHRSAMIIGHRAPAPPPEPQSPAEPPSDQPLPPVVPLSTDEPGCDPICARDIASRITAQRLELPSRAWRLAAGALLRSGIAVDVSPGLWFDVSIQRDALSFLLELRGTFPGQAVKYGIFGNSDISTLSTLIAPCSQWSIIYGCFFVETGLLIHTLPFDQSSSAAVLFSVGPRMGLLLPLGRGLTLRAFGDAAFHPYVPKFALLSGKSPDPEAVSWVIAPVSGGWGVGLGWSG